MPKLPQVTAGSCHCAPSGVELRRSELSADLIKVSNVCVAAIAASYRLCKPAQTARLIIKHAQCTAATWSSGSRSSNSSSNNFSNGSNMQHMIELHFAQQQQRATGNSQQKAGNNVANGSCKRATATTMAARVLDLSRSRLQPG